MFVITLTDSPNSVDEGNTVTYTVEAPSDISSEQTLSVAVSGSTVDGVADKATGDDFNLQSNTVTVGPNSTTATFKLDATADSESETTEGIQVSLLDENNEVVSGGTDTTLIQNVPGADGGLALQAGTDNVQGTSGNDTLSGVFDTAGGSSSETTWDITDTVDLGDGTDSFNVSVLNEGTNNLSGRSTSNTEKFFFAHVDADSVADDNVQVATGSFGGATEIWANGGSSVDNGNDASTDDTITFNGIAEGVTIGAKNNSANLEADYNFESGATDSSSDSVTLAAGGGTTGKVDLGDQSFETVNIATSGDASTISTLSLNGDSTTVNVSGDKAIEIGNRLSTVETFDASGNSGAVTATLDAGSSLDADGGSGGSDELTLRVDSSVSSGMSVKGFETANLFASSSADLDLSLIEGTNSTNIAGSGSSGRESNTLTLNSVAAGTPLNFEGTGDAEDNFFNEVVYNLSDASGNNDSVDVSINNDGTSASDSTATVGNSSSIDLGDVEDVSLSTSDFGTVNAGLSITPDDTAELEINASTTLDLTAVGGFSANSSLETINAGGSSGDVTYGTLSGVTGNLSLTGSSGVDSLTNAGVSEGSSQTIETGEGDDSITIAQLGGSTDNDTNGTASLTVDGGAGNETFTVDHQGNNNSVGRQGIGSTSDADDMDITINGGDGSDDELLIQTDSSNTESFIAQGFSGVENITFSGSSADETTILNVSDGYSDTVEVTATASGATLTFQSDSAGASVNLSNLSFTGQSLTMNLNGADGNETLTGSSVADTIDAGAGADTVNLGTDGKTDDYVHAENDGESQTGVTDTSGDGSGALDDTDVVTFGNDVDVVNGFEDTSDMLDFDITGTTFSSTTTDETGSDLGVSANQFATVRGDFDDANGEFTVDSSNGSDKLVLFDAGSGSGVQLEAVMLVGNGGDTIDSSDIVG